MNNNTVIQGNTVLVKQDYLFNLEPYFQSDRLDFTNAVYFQQDKLSGNVQKYPYANYHKFVNSYMENEVKGFIRHLVVDKHHAASYVKDYVIVFVSAWCDFVNEKHLEMGSVLDCEYELLYNEYSDWLEATGRKTIVTHRSVQVTKDMEWLYFTHKSFYLLGLGVFYRFIEGIVFPDNTPEKQKDVWDVRNLGIPYSTLPSRPRYTINYTAIKQDWLREIIKAYNIYRIPHKAMSTVLDDMKAFNLFSQFLDTKKEITSLKDIDRAVIEDYIAFTNEKGYVASTYNRRLSAIKTFFEIGNMLSMDDFPVKKLFLDSDTVKLVHKMPVPFSDNELKQFNEHMHNMPIIYQRALVILENCGMRMSDLFSTKIVEEGQHCLHELNNGNFTFTYYMPKVHRTNTIPVDELLVMVIKDMIKDSQEEYGSDCKYLFARSKDKAIGEEDFVMAMNKLSKRCNILSDTGELLRVKGHTFRRTKATELVNNTSVPMEAIRALLGQRSIGVLKHYAVIHSATMVDVMSEIIEEDNQLILNIGKKQEQVIESIPDAEVKSAIPMPNGYCVKSLESGLCEHANKCYECAMFKASKSCLEVYKRQLKQAEINVEMARMSGKDTLLQINTDLVVHLKQIISSVEAVN